MVLAGAGLSTSAGLPDFRTPGTGFYARLREHGLEFPEQVFDIDLFRSDPRVFYAFARDLAPKPASYQPTLAHYFLRILADKGRLLRLFSQNVDGLEYLAGLPESRVINAHGSFRGGHCAGSDTSRPCGHRVEAEEIRAIVEKGDAGASICPRCEAGYVKPAIVFFGENLPQEFWFRAETDLPKADALIVMGTSLQVYPFAGLVDQVPITVPRLLINRTIDGSFASPSGRARDFVFQGSCDDGVRELARLIGFGEELMDLAERERRLVKEWGAELEASAGQKSGRGFWNGLPWLDEKEQPGTLKRGKENLSPVPAPRL